jgi:hypothetical protein
MYIIYIKYINGLLFSHKEELQIIMLSKISQSKKDKCVLPQMWNLDLKKTKHDRNVKSENSLRVRTSRRRVEG